jgi:DNA-binding HxlR family transcriptional regulator
MRSYGQWCALAKALDVLGDRWTLLVVRELMMYPEGARYTDLRDGLPGIASNLLSERLRDLEGAGVLERHDAPPPIAATLYRLTERGRALRATLRELGRWGAPLLAAAPKNDEVRGHWIALPAEIYLADGAPGKPASTLEVRADDDLVTLTIGGGEVRASMGAARKPDAAIVGPAREVARVLLAGAPLARARKHGVTYTGDARILKRLIRR